MQTFNLRVDRVRHNELQFALDGKILVVGALPYTFLDLGSGTSRGLPELGLGSWGWALIRSGGAIAHIPSSDVLTVLDLATGKADTRKVENGSARGIVADRTGDTLFLTVGDPNFRPVSEIRVMNAADLKPRATFGQIEAYLGRMAISADGQQLVAYAGSDYNASLRDPNPSLRVWCIPDEKLPKRARVRIAPRNPVNAFGLAHDGKLLAVADGYALSLWDTSNGEKVASSGQHRRAVTAVACSPKQPLLVSGDNVGKVFLWDTTGRILKRYDWGLGAVSGLAFDPDGLRAAAVDEGGKVVVWDIDG